MTTTLIRNIFVILHLLLVSAVSLCGQENYAKEVDSLLLTTKKDSLFTSYTNLGDLIANQNESQAQRIFDYVIAQDSSDLARIFLYRGMGTSLSRGGKIDASLQYKFNGLKLAQKLDLEKMQLDYHNAIANAFHFKNKLDSATYHLNIAEALAERIAKNRLVDIYYNRAFVQGSLGNNEEAAHYYRLMWDRSKDSHNSKQKGFTLWVATNFFTQTDSFPEDQTMFLDLLSQQYDNQEINVPPGHVDVKDFFKNEVSQENIDKYKNLVAISDSLNQINSFYHNSSVLSNILSKKGKHNEAIQYLKNTASKLEKLDKTNYLLDTYKQLAENYEASRNYKNALTTQKKEYLLRDSVISEQVRKNVSELEVKYDTEKKEREIVLQKLDLERKDRQKSNITWGLIGVAVLSGISFLVFRYRLSAQETIAAQQKAIQEKEISALRQSNKLLSLNNMIEGQEKERHRIAQDLHDSLGGLLSTVKAHFSIIQKGIEQLEYLNITKKTNQLIDEACVEVRRISHNMQPQSLAISGLQGAIEDIAQQLITQKYDVTLQLEGLKKSNNTARDAAIYRLIQEIISNIRKHANASAILIQIIENPDRLSIILEDNGQGFDYKQATEKGGLGLKSINSRVTYLDGIIDWDTRIGAGTSINITIPHL